MADSAVGEVQGPMAEARETIGWGRERFEAGSCRDGAVPRLDRWATGQIRRSLLAGQVHATWRQKQMVGKKPDHSARTNRAGADEACWFEGDRAGAERWALGRSLCAAKRGDRS